jgi:hypothetical protein
LYLGSAKYQLLTSPQLQTQSSRTCCTREEVEAAGLQVLVIILAEQFEARGKQLPLRLSWKQGQIREWGDEDSTKNA